MAEEERSPEEPGRGRGVLESYADELKISKERIPVLIGKKGTVKRRIEKKTQTKIKVNSQEGDVLIVGQDSLGVYEARHVVQAVGRGFNPDVAVRILHESMRFELLNIQDYTGKSKKKMVRLKSRVIGLKGRAWKMLEQMTGTTISVYGKTVGIIGKVEDVLIARQAVESLLNGAPHGNVYKWIQKQQWQRARFDD